MTITDQIKELRAKTGVGIMKCKEAITATNGDQNLAIEYLRKSGIADAEGRSGRKTTEGYINTLITPTSGVMVEVLCETDFVSATDRFQTFCHNIAHNAINSVHEGDITKFVIDSEEGNVGDIVASLQENIKINRVVRWTTDGNIIGYVHPNQPIGVLVDVSGGDSEFLGHIAQHIAASKPEYLTPSDIPKKLIESERKIHLSTLSGKPEAILDKIVNGKMQKWYSNVCLSDQQWFFSDDKMPVSKVSNATINRFEYWRIG